MLVAGLLLALAAAQEPAPQPEITGYEVQIEGAEQLSARNLRKAAVDEEADLVKNGYRRAEVDDMAFQMESFAHGRGYPEARVRWSTEVRDGVLHALFTVHEGRYCVIEEVRVEGATHLPAEELARTFHPRDYTIQDARPAFVESRVRSAPAAIRTLYRGRGYRRVQVSPVEITFSEDRTQAFLHCMIDEGPQFLIQEIRYAGNTKFPTAQLEEFGDRLLGKPYFPRRRFELGQRIVDLYADAGYADARAEVSAEEDPETGRVSFSVEVSEGPRVRIGAISFQGNAKTRESFLRQRLTLESGDWTSHAEEVRSFRELYRTGLFNRVRLELQGEGETRDLLVDLEESDHREFILEPGYGSYEKLRLLIGWRDKNIFGTGRILRAETRPTMKSFNALIGLTDPWLFESAVELDAPLFFRKRQEPSFTREEAGLALQFRYAHTHHLSYLWGYRITRSRVSSESAGLPPDILIGDTTLGSVFAGVRYDTQNDYFNPTRGGQTWLQFEHGGELWGSEVEFLRGEFKLSHHWPLTEDETSVLAASFRTTAIAPIGDTDEIPIQLRLFNGGENTVRSFTESRLGPLDSAGEPLGGEVSNVANLELRQQMNGALWGALFVDAGNASLSRSAWFDDFRPGYGIGLRYLLPVGALRLDWAYNPSPRGREDQSVLHLSVGMAF